ncbi:alpha/beta hydrolase [Candidatus Aminicenantes bacterium AC-708-M15]|nr:alpha/beta hydrolase [Candidatus Aminicenantes bacterium AC-708-M15]
MKLKNYSHYVILIRLFLIICLLASCYSMYIGVVNSPLDKKLILKNIIYTNKPNVDRKKQCLDFYIPPNTRNFPILIFVHGGGWMSGDKREYKFLGKFLAFNGIGTVIINYRLSPKVKHPAHIEDVASAFAWVYKNAKKFGGDSNKIFLMGHSAGAHLSALLALDEKYLEAYGLSTSLIKGTILIDGIYDLTLGGKKDTWFSKAFFKRIFGDKQENRICASPIFHINGKSSPFLIIHAENDHLIPKKEPLKFYEILKKHNNPVKLFFIPGKNHITVLTSIGKRGDYTTELIFSFIDEYSSF